MYLADWLNVDVPGPKTYLARERPDLVEQWKTAESHYYAKHQDKSIETLRTGPLDQEYVCDVYGDFFSLPVATYEVDELLARQVFEHLSIREAKQALNECLRVMRRGGVLRLDVPDHEETLKLYKQTGDEFYVRHLLGPRRNAWGFHMMSYDRPRLRELVERHGFKFQHEEENIHFFPAFCLRFQKP